MSIQKQARSVVYSSSYSNNIMPVQSKAAPMQVQFQQNKLFAKNKKKGFKGGKNHKKFSLGAKAAGVVTPGVTTKAMPQVKKGAFRSNN